MIKLELGGNDDDHVLEVRQNIREPDFDINKWIENQGRFAERLENGIDDLLDRFDFLAVMNQISLVASLINDGETALRGLMPNESAKINSWKDKIPEWVNKLKEKLKYSLDLSPSQYIETVKYNFFGAIADERYLTNVADDVGRIRKTFHEKIEIYHEDGFVTDEQYNALKSELDRLLKKAEESIEPKS